MRPSRIQAIDHVHREAPLDTEEALRWFYGAIGCLDILEASEEVTPCLRFRSASIELRIVCVEDPRLDLTGFPVSLAVPSLEEAAEQLADASWEFERITATTWGDRRFAMLDPGGNRVELKQDWPFGLI